MRPAMPPPMTRARSPRRFMDPSGAAAELSPTEGHGGAHAGRPVPRGSVVHGKSAVAANLPLVSRRLLGCGLVRLEESPRVLDDLVDVLLRVLPGINRHLRVRGEAGHLHGDLVRVSGYV